jgi:hypothetical protein
VKFNQPIVKIDVPLFPLEVTFVRYFPTTLDSKRFAGEEKFFTIHNAKVSVVGATMITKCNVEAPSCNGTLCDRQMVFAVNQNCGCMHVEKGKSGFVLKYTVFFEYVESERREKLIVKDQRSLRTTQLFINNPEDCNRGHNAYLVGNIKLRECIQKCTEYINANGGFTVMGSKVLGESSQEESNIKTTSEELTYHVVYLYPTDTDIPSRTEYKKLMYDFCTTHM